MRIASLEKSLQTLVHDCVLIQRLVTFADRVLLDSAEAEVTVALGGLKGGHHCLGPEKKTHREIDAIN